MNRQDVFGPWKLVSMEAANQEGELLYPFGESPSGMILYDPSGFMSYTAMRAERPKFASGDLAGLLRFGYRKIRSHERFS